MFGKKKDAEAEFTEEEMMPEEETVVKADTAMHVSGIQIGFSVVFLVLGGLLLFVPKITPAILCYSLAGGIMGIGVILIVRYFMTEAYKNIQSYGFSFGVLLILCGSIILARTTILSEYLYTALGALMLAASVFKLQNALDLKAIRDAYWWIWLLIAFVFAIFATVIIVNPFSDKKTLAQFASVLVLIDGIISLIGTLYLAFRLRAWKKQLDADPESNETFHDETPGTQGHHAPVEAAHVQAQQGIKTSGIQEDFDEGIDD